MKLRIRGNTIRVRLTQSEVASLGERGSLEEITDFGNEQRLVVRLSSGPQTSPGATFIDGTIEISLPFDQVDTWATSDDVSIEGSTPTLRILVEKDFTCLNPRAGDEDTDTFPHPRERDHSC